MEQIWNFIEIGVTHTSNFLWTYLLSFILVAGGTFLTFRIKFFQFRFFGHVLHQTIGQIFKKIGRPERFLPSKPSLPPSPQRLAQQILSAYQ